ncbi:MAG TPA: hypothetical protein VF574_18555 [Allosphingosinicella sp.]|jgi:hypothetical protein
MTYGRKILLLPVAAAALAASGPAAAQPAPVFQFEYAVKIVCGRISNSRGPLALGNYAVAVNIHNPGAPQGFARKIAIAFPGQPGPISPFKLAALKKDQAMEVDCTQIAIQLQEEQIATPGFFTGFLVIQSFQPLDVVAVYTAAPLASNEVAGLHTERVTPRKMQ